MSTQRSLQALIERAKATLVAKTGQSNPAIDAIACAIAGVSYGQYGYQDQLFRELHPETCSEPWLYLHASRHSVQRLLPTLARGFVRFIELSGVVVVKKGTQLVDASGLIFETIKEQMSDSPVEVTALQTGTFSNLAAGTPLKLTQGQNGLDPNQVTCLGFSGGADIEALEHWRSRVVTSFNENELVGRAGDYEQWAVSAHSDVDYAWALDNTPERGMVEVYVGARENNPILSDEVLHAVQAMFETQRLAGCHPIALKPMLRPINIEIQGVEDEAVRSNVITVIQKLIQQKMGRINPQTKLPESITPTEIVLAIATVTNNYIVRSPVTEVVIAQNQIHVLGEVTWTPPS